MPFGVRIPVEGLVVRAAHEDVVPTRAVNFCKWSIEGPAEAASGEGHNIEIHR
jgi:hypothetical protein